MSILGLWYKKRGVGGPAFTQMCMFLLHVLAGIYLPWKLLLVMSVLYSYKVFLHSLVSGRNDLNTTERAIRCLYICLVNPFWKYSSKGWGKRKKHWGEKELLTQLMFVLSRTPRSHSGLTNTNVLAAQPASSEIFYNNFFLFIFNRFNIAYFAILIDPFLFIQSLPLLVSSNDFSSNSYL